MTALWLLFAVSLLDGPTKWEEVKVGQCLSVEELQTLSGVVSAEPYELESCKLDYPMSGLLYASHACGLEMEVGSWEREVVQHKMAGLFFPSPVPCKKSISYFKGDFQVYEEMEPTSCDYVEPRLLYSQKEEMFTKKFGAGQGDLYLPHPMIITRTWEADSLGFEACEQTRLSLSYDGWGALSGNISRLNCWDGKESFCRNAKMKNSKTSEGVLCLKFTEIKDCK